VLRPPTYEKLTETLQTAKQNGIPYDIVHFDGHGTFDDPDSLGITGRVISGRLPGSGSGGSRHGFIIFEAPPGPDGQIFTSSGGRGKPVFVDGFALGSLLRETSVPVLVLNACQSAFAEAPAEPATLEAGSSMREEVEAYGSFAQAVLDAGDAAGVVAMRYAVYVPTAERFVAELYTALADGRTLGGSKPIPQAFDGERGAKDWIQGHASAGLAGASGMGGCATPAVAGGSGSAPTISTQ